MRWASRPSAASSGYRPPGRWARSANRNTIAATTIAASTPMASTAAVLAHGNSNAARSPLAASPGAAEGLEPAVVPPGTRSDLIYCASPQASLSSKCGVGPDRLGTRYPPTRQAWGMHGRLSLADGKLPLGGLCGMPIAVALSADRGRIGRELATRAGLVAVPRSDASLDGGSAVPVTPQRKHHWHSVKTAGGMSRTWPFAVGSRSRASIPRKPDRRARQPLAARVARRLRLPAAPRPAQCHRNG